MKIIAILAILAVIVAVIVVAIYVMGMFEQTKPLADAAMALPNKAVDFVQNNGVISTTAITGGLTALSGVALSKIQSSAQKKVEDVTTDLKAQANTEIESVKQQASEAVQVAETKATEAIQVAETKADETKQGYETQITDLKKQLEDSTVDVNAVNQLKQKLAGVEEMHTNFVQQLSGNNEKVIDGATGEVYKVIKIVESTVK